MFISQKSNEPLALIILSVFHLEACKGIAGHVLRYSVKDKNYYLRVYSEGRVRLRVSSKPLIRIPLTFLSMQLISKACLALQTELIR